MFIGRNLFIVSAEFGLRSRRLLLDRSCTDCTHTHTLTHNGYRGNSIKRRHTRLITYEHLCAVVVMRYATTSSSHRSPSLTTTRIQLHLVTAPQTHVETSFLWYTTVCPGRKSSRQESCRANDENHRRCDCIGNEEVNTNFNWSISPQFEAATSLSAEVHE